MKNVVIIIAIVFILAIGVFVKWGCDTLVGSGKGVVEKTLNPDNVLFNYEYFHDQFQSYNKLQSMLKTTIDTKETLIETIGKDRTKWSDYDKFDYLKLEQQEVAIRNQISECITKYNAESSKINVKIFKDKNLPYRLED